MSRSSLNIESLPLEIFSFILELHLQDLLTTQFQNDKTIIPVWTRFDYPALFNTSKWKPIDPKRVFPLRLVNKQFQLGIDSIIFENVSYVFHYLRADYLSIEDVYDPITPKESTRFGHSFGMMDNLSINITPEILPVPIYNNRFSDIYSNVDLVNKKPLSRKPFFSIPYTDYSKLSLEKIGHNIRHLFVEIGVTIKEDFYSSLPLGSISVDNLPNISEFSIKFQDLLYKPNLIRHLKSHSFKRCLDRHVQANNAKFHLNLCVQYYQSLLKYLDLKESIVSIVLDEYERDNGLSMGLISDYCPNVKTLVFGVTNEPISDIQRVQELEFLEELFITENIDSHAMRKTAPELNLPPNLSRLSIDISWLLILAKRGQSFDNISHLCVNVNEETSFDGFFFLRLSNLLCPELSEEEFPTFFRSLTFSLFPNLEAFELSCVASLDLSLPENWEIFTELIGRFILSNPVKKFTIAMEIFSSLKPMVPYLKNIEDLSIVTIPYEEEGYGEGYAIMEACLPHDERFPNLKRLSFKGKTGLNFESLKRLKITSRSFLDRFPKLETIDGLYAEFAIEREDSINYAIEFLLLQLDSDPYFSLKENDLVQFLELVVYDNEEYQDNYDDDDKFFWLTYYPTCLRINLIKYREFLVKLRRGSPYTRTRSRTTSA